MASRNDSERSRKVVVRPGLGSARRVVKGGTLLHGGGQFKTPVQVSSGRCRVGLRQSARSCLVSDDRSCTDSVFIAATRECITWAV